MQPVADPILAPLDSNILVYVSLVLFLVASAMTAVFIVPLQFRLTQVKNGLALLRRQLLLKGAIQFIADVIASYFVLVISLRVLENGTIVSTVSQVLLFLLSFSHFAVAYINYKIYHQQYSLEHLAGKERR